MALQPKGGTMNQDREQMTGSQGVGPTPGFRNDRQTTMKIVSGGSITEALAGAGTVIVAILGLAGTMSGMMAAVAAITLGVALLAQGGAAASRWSRIVHEARGRFDDRAELGGGLGAEIFGGMVGLVLGVLALLDIVPLTLLPIALLVFGGSVLLGSGVTMELGSLGSAEAYDRPAQYAREATLGASGAQVLSGVGAIVLGILALIGTRPLTLSLIGLLALGAAVLFSGSAVSSRMLSVLRR